MQMKLHSLVQPELHKCFYASSNAMIIQIDAN